MAMFCRSGKKAQNAYGTRCSQAVTHPSTDRARRCLTSVIRREPVFSTWYGRKRQCQEEEGFYTKDTNTPTSTKSTFPLSQHWPSTQAVALHTQRASDEANTGHPKATLHCSFHKPPPLPTSQQAALLHTAEPLLPSLCTWLQCYLQESR